MYNLISQRKIVIQSNLLSKLKSVILEVLKYPGGWPWSDTKHEFEIQNSVLLFKKDQKKQQYDMGGNNTSLGVGMSGI